VESLSPINNSERTFLGFLGGQIADILGETLEGSFCFQPLLVLIQRFNDVMLHDSFVNLAVQLNNFSNPILHICRDRMPPRVISNNNANDNMNISVMH